MAISQSEYTFLSLISQLLTLPEKPNILEFGEQHWHGDVSVEDVKQDVEAFSSEECQILLNELDTLLKRTDDQKSFDFTKIIYKIFFDYQEHCSIDLHGTENSLPFDLNHEISLDQKFDITINFGTGEHVFNVFQFFKTIHESTQAEGIMLHAMPFLGWIDHGFFNFQPTFYWDLAESNGYDVLAFLFIQGKEFVSLDERDSAIHYLKTLQTEPKNCPLMPSNIYAAMRQSKHPDEFKIPMQKYFQITPEEYWSLSQKI